MSENQSLPSRVRKYRKLAEDPVNEGLYQKGRVYYRLV